MIEVLWHGRGGQGAFTAARLLGAAVSASGAYQALAFPSFGPERRGAPVLAFNRFDTEPIGDRSAIAQADFVIYLDETLFSPTWAQELKNDGVVLINSARSFDDPRIIALDGNTIAQACMNRPQGNTAMLGALSVLCPAIKLDDLIEAVHESLAPRLWAGNEATLRAAAEAMRSLLEYRDSETASPTLTTPKEPRFEKPLTDLEETAEEIQDRFPLSAAPRNPLDYAQNTCYEAPLIVKDNAGWRSQRPIVDASRCVGCRECFTYCPDGALIMVPRDQKWVEPSQRAGALVPQLDTRFCKGCGVCVHVCPVQAIEMVPELHQLNQQTAPKEQQS